MDGPGCLLGSVGNLSGGSAASERGSAQPAFRVLSKPTPAARNLDGISLPFPTQGDTLSGLPTPETAPS